MSQKLDDSAREVFRKFGLAMYQVDETVVHRFSNIIGRVTEKSIWKSGAFKFLGVSYRVINCTGRSFEPWESMLRLATVEEEIAFENMLAKQYTRWGYTTCPQPL